MYLLDNKILFSLSILYSIVEIAYTSILLYIIWCVPTNEYCVKKNYSLVAVRRKYRVF